MIPDQLLRMSIEIIVLLLPVSKLRVVYTPGSYGRLSCRYLCNLPTSVVVVVAIVSLQQPQGVIGWITALLQ